MLMADDKIQTEKKTNQEQLEQLSKLTGQLAHEIKNPLSTIKINLRLINEELSEFQDKYDRETDYSRDHEAQARWNRWIAQQLSVPDR